MAKYQAVFIDRDGTMGHDANVEFPETFRPFDDLKETIALLRNAGIKVFAFTNQSCIARGKDGGYDFGAEFDSWGLDDYFICPHDSGDGCDCRKPLDGLLLRARDKYALDFSRCAVIGDRWSDLFPGLRGGMDAVLVRTGRGAQTLENDLPLLGEYRITYIAENLREAALWLIRPQAK